MLTDVHVPIENLIGSAGKGHEVAFNILNIGRAKLGATAVGASKTAFRDALQYSKHRRGDDNKPTAEHSQLTTANICSSSRNKTPSITSPGEQTTPSADATSRGVRSQPPRQGITRLPADCHIYCRQLTTDDTPSAHSCSGPRGHQLSFPPSSRLLDFSTLQLSSFHRTQLAPFLTIYTLDKRGRLPPLSRGMLILLLSGET